MMKLLLLCSCALAVITLVVFFAVGKAPPPAPVMQPAVTPPAESPVLLFPGDSKVLKDEQVLRVGDDVEVLWAHGATMLKARKGDKQLWSQTLGFAVADARPTTDARILVTSTDGLRTVTIEPHTGEFSTATAKNPHVPTDISEHKGLIERVKKTYALALKHHKERKAAEALAACDQLVKLSEELAKAGLQKKSFKVWAATRKLRKAVDPDAAVPTAIEEYGLEVEIF